MALAFEEDSVSGGRVHTVGRAECETMHRKDNGRDPGADAADCRLLTTAAPPFKLFV